MIARIVQVAVGVWLMVSPAVLGYDDPAQANDRIFGPVAGSLAFVAIWEVVRPVRWATVPVAVWFVVAPLLLGYDEADAIVNSAVCGIVIGTAAFLGGDPDDRFWGGWRSLLGDLPGPECDAPHLDHGTVADDDPTVPASTGRTR